MRLLIATGLYPPDIGGPATYTKLFEDRLPQEGIEVSVLPFSSVRHLPRLVRHVAYALKLGLLARGVDAILVQDTVSTGVPAALVARFMRKKLVVRVPGDYAWEQGVQRFGVKDSLDEFQKKAYGVRVGLLRMLQKHTVQSAVRVIAPSMYLKRIVDGWGVNATVIYNGIDTRKTDAVREENLILSAGRLVPWKGFAQLIQVVPKHPEWKLAIVGDGPDKESLVKMAADAPNIRLLGNIPNSELRRLMAQCSVFVLNSDYEGLSHVLLEAGAEGAPISTTNVGGNAEVVPAESLIEKSDLESRLIELLSDSERRAKWSARSVSMASAFSIDSCIQKTAALLKSL